MLMLVEAGVSNGPAIYRRIFKPKIFTDITTPSKLCAAQMLVDKHNIRFWFETFTF